MEWLSPPNYNPPIYPRRGRLCALIAGGVGIWAVVIGLGWLAFVGR